MAENDNYLHVQYPNLRPQIDEAIEAGYSLQETHDHIAGKVNEARRNGYTDEEVNQSTGTTIPQARGGYNPFLTQLYKAAGALNKGVAGFTKGITEPGQYINEKLGIGRSKVVDDMVSRIVEQYLTNQEYWESRAREKGATFVDEIVGEAVGGGIPGVLEFALGVPYYAVTGAIEAKSQGQDEIIGAIHGAVKRTLLGKMFHAFGQLRQPLKAVSMGGVMAGEVAGAGGTPEEIAKAGGVGVIFSLGGRGRMGIKEIRDLHTGRTTYEPVVRSNQDVIREEAKGAEEIQKKREEWRKAKEEAVVPKEKPVELIQVASLADPTKVFKVGQQVNFDSGLVGKIIEKNRGGLIIEGDDRIYNVTATYIIPVSEPTPMMEERLSAERTLEAIETGRRLALPKAKVEEQKVTPRLLELEKEENKTLNRVYNGVELTPEEVRIFESIRAQKVEENNKGEEQKTIVREWMEKEAEEAAKRPEEIVPILGKTVSEAERELGERHVRPGYAPPPSGMLPAIMADGEVFAGTEGHTGIAMSPKYKAIIDNAKEVKVGWVDPDGKFYDNQEEAVKVSEALRGGLKTPEGERYEKFIEETTKGKPEGKVWWRAGGVNYPSEWTAGDVVRNEQSMGRSLQVKKEKLAELDKYPAGSLLWMSEKEADARLFGAPTKRIFQDYEVIDKDVEGGSLVLDKTRGKPEGVGKLLGVVDIVDVNPEEPIRGFIDSQGRLLGQSIHDHAAMLNKLGEYYGRPKTLPEKFEIDMTDMMVKENLIRITEGGIDIRIPPNANQMRAINQIMIREKETGEDVEFYADIYNEKGEIKESGVVTNNVQLGKLVRKVYAEIKPEGVGAEKGFIWNEIESKDLVNGNILKVKKLAGQDVWEVAKFTPEGAETGDAIDARMFYNKNEAVAQFKKGTVGAEKARKETKLYGTILDKQKALDERLQEIELAAFDENYTKVGRLTENIDKKIDDMINTAEKMSRAAFASGDKLGAIREHKKMVDLRNNRETIKREHDKLKRETDSMIRRMKKFAVMESIDPEYRDQIGTILEDYDLHKRGAEYKERRQSTLDFLARMEEQGEAIYIDEAKVRQLRKVPVNDISIEELRDVFDTVKQLAHLGALKRKLLLARGKKDFIANKDGLLESIKENVFNYKEPADKEATFPSEREPNRTWIGRFRKKIGSFSGATKIEYILDKLDGFRGKMYEVQGKAYDLVFRPSVLAERERIKLIKSDTEALDRIIQPIKKDFLRIMREQEEINGRNMTRMEMISVYWNSRNEGNRETLRKGLALPDEAIDNIVRKLTPAERKFADDVMVMIQDKGPAIAKVLRKLTGQKMRFEKDYFPIWFDYELSERAAERQQETNLLKQVYMKVGAERGFTVSRVGGIEAPYLSFDVVLKHLERVNHFISSAMAIRDVQKVVFDKEIRREIETNAGEGAYREIVEWLKDWGNPKRGYQGDLDRWFGILRHNSTIAVLGFKLSTILLQPTAYFQLVNRIGIKNSMVGLIDFYRAPFENTQKIYEMSPFMQTRSHSFDRDLMDYMNTDPFYSKHTKLKHAAMGAISALDLATTLPCWQAAFNLGVKQFGWNEARAIEYADLMTRRTQGSGMPKDLPGVLRGSNFKKAMTMFYTYFSSTYNEAARDYRAFRAGEENIGNLVKSFMYLFVIPAAIQSLMRKREEIKGTDFVTEIIGNVAGTIPYVGPIINAVITGYDYQASPIFEMPKQITMGIKSKEWEKRMEHLFMAAGYIAGIPARQTVLLIKYLGDVLSGRSYDPANLVYREKEKKGRW